MCQSLSAVSRPDLAAAPAMKIIQKRRQRSGYNIRPWLIALIASIMLAALGHGSDFGLFIPDKAIATKTLKHNARSNNMRSVFTAARFHLLLLGHERHYMAFSVERLGVFMRCGDWPNFYCIIWVQFPDQEVIATSRVRPWFFRLEVDNGQEWQGRRRYLTQKCLSQPGSQWAFRLNGFRCSARFFEWRSANVGVHHPAAKLPATV